MQFDAIRQGIKDFAEWPTIPQLYVNGEFVNLEETEMMTGDMPMSEFFKKDSLRSPLFELQTQEIDLNSFISKSEKSISKIAWLGHSAFIMNLEGKIILLDPMLGEYAAPFPIPSLKRYSEKTPFKIDDDYEIMYNVKYNLGRLNIVAGFMTEMNPKMDSEPYFGIDYKLFKNRKLKIFYNQSDMMKTIGIKTPILKLGKK